MIIQYYTLYHVVWEMQSLIGCKLLECFSQEKNSCLMNFSDGINDFYLQYYGNQPNTSLFFRKNFSRARKNTVDLFESIQGEILQSVQLHEKNRIVQMDFVNSSIYFFMFGAAKSNMIGVNKSRIVIHSLKSMKDLAGKKIELPDSKLVDLSSVKDDLPVIDALAKSNYNLGKFYSEEVLLRLGFDFAIRINELSKNEFENIKKSAEQLRSECLNSTSYYILDTPVGFLLSLIPSSKFKDKFNIFSNISEAIEQRVISNIKEKSYNQIYKEILGELERQKKRTERNLLLIKDENAMLERIAQYKRFAELLLSQPEQKIKSGNTIHITDFWGDEIVIPLDNKLTILDNANKYFDKVRKSKEELKIRKQRLPELTNKLNKIDLLIDELSDAETLRDLQIISKKINELQGKKMSNENDISTKFREFDLGEGYLLYVGKNASNNDELTMKFAKPNYLWFHARGSGGSHAVLKVNKDQKPPKFIIKKAASIAAYYSKARNAKYVPVAYTQKKYVRKPKGANVGSVVISKEEVIMVEPKLP